MSGPGKKHLSAPDSVGRLKAIRGDLIPYIQYIRFPRYRSLEPGTRIDFEFPLTVLIGRNGTNKSSVLHALRGSAAKKSVADYWFETDVDKITYEIDGLRQSVVHAYVPAGGAIVQEVLKTRFHREGNPDYWEPAKPYRKYGMDPRMPRTRPIDMPVVYLDFRAELSAFDKFFYFPDERRLAQADKRRRRGRERKGGAKPKRAKRYTKQDYIRSRSSRIRTAISRLDAHQGAASSDIEEATLLTEEELAALRWILEKPYTGGKYIYHKIYGGKFGKTIVFHTVTLQGYTEAFAGSGEFAVGALVHEVLCAADHSLVLLDEPETSLHPAAQGRLRDFLLEQALKKKLQVVLSTHSPQFAAELPDEAIKVFEADSSGIVHVRPSSTPREAFFELGPPSPGTLKILVEDRNAEILTASCIKAFFPDAQESIHVSFRPGGVSAIYRDIETYAREKRSDVFVLLDGDQNPGSAAPVDPAALPGNVRSCEKELRKLVNRLVHSQKLPFAGDPVGGRLAFLGFFHKKVTYLPDLNPERLVWNILFAEEFLRRYFDPSEARKKAALTDCACDKEKYQRVADIVGCAMTSEVVYREFVTHFIRTDGDKCKAIRDIIDGVRSGRLRRPAAP